MILEKNGRIDSMDNTKELVEALINGCTTLVARNKYGNVVTITSSFDIPETTLREIEKGILEEECSNMMTDFFRNLRKKKRSE